MLKEIPKLNITGEQGNGVPVLAQCSICGGRTAFYAKGTTIEGNTKDLQEQFRKHVSKCHSGEDVNQAAARIVREATQD